MVHKTNAYSIHNCIRIRIHSDVLCGRQAHDAELKNIHDELREKYDHICAIHSILIWDSISAIRTESTYGVDSHVNHELGPNYWFSSWIIPDFEASLLFFPLDYFPYLPSSTFSLIASALFHPDYKQRRYDQIFFLRGCTSRASQEDPVNLSLSSGTSI